MDVSVQYVGMVQRALGVRQETVALPVGSRVGDLLQALVVRHGPRFREAIFGPDGRVAPEAVIMVDGFNVMVREGLDTPLPAAAQAEIVVLGPPITGGMGA